MKAQMNTVDCAAHWYGSPGPAQRLQVGPSHLGSVNGSDFVVYGATALDSPFLMDLSLPVIWALFGRFLDVFFRRDLFNRLADGCGAGAVAAAASFPGAQRPRLDWWLRRGPLGPQPASAAEPSRERCFSAEARNACTPGRKENRDGHKRGRGGG